MEKQFTVIATIVIAILSTISLVFMIVGFIVSFVLFIIGFVMIAGGEIEALTDFITIAGEKAASLTSGITFIVYSIFLSIASLMCLGFNKAFVNISIMLKEMNGKIK